MRILAIFTCFNRKEKTENCIHTLVEGNPDLDFTIIAVDDNSTDGTKQVLNKMKTSYDIHLIEGNGKLYYSGGMRMGMEYALKTIDQGYDYMLMLNDDVSFIEHKIEMLVEQSMEQDNAIIVGAMMDDDGKLSYSAIEYTKGIKYKKIPIENWEKNADTFNANCVLIPFQVFKKIGTIDKYYIHSLGDFDYGLMIKKNGYKIHTSKEYVGICNINSNLNTWSDKALKIKERIKKKEDIKGAPTKQWFYFLRKNFNLFIAIKGAITPYIRIILKR